MAQMFAADDPDSLRGPQFDAAWCDELCKWRVPEKAWDMLQFALRLGPLPQCVVTTTPRPIALLTAIKGDEATVTSRSRTVDNVANLAPRSWPRCNAATPTRRSAGRSSTAKCAAFVGACLERAGVRPHALADGALLPRLGRGARASRAPAPSPS